MNPLHRAGLENCVNTKHFVRLTVSCAHLPTKSQAMSAEIPPRKRDKLHALFSASELEALERTARDCTRRHPGASLGWQMLGVAFLARGRGEEALPHLLHAVRLAPDDPAIRDNLGLTLLRLGRPAAAEPHFEQATRHDPQRMSAWVNWSQAARQAGHPARAEHCARQALALAPHSPEAHLNLGNALADQQHWDAAESHYRNAALCAAPGWIEPALNLGNLFDRQSRFADAATCLDALSHTPAADWRVFSALGRARSMLGDTAAARDAYARALALNPRAAAAYSGYLYHLMHDPGASAETIFAEHCRFGDALDASLNAPAPRHAHDRNPERPLRIGFVSGDLRRHAVAHFMEPMFEALGQRGLDLVAYSNLAREDEVSARLRGPQYLYLHGNHDAVAGPALAAPERLQLRADDFTVVFIHGHQFDPVFQRARAAAQDRKSVV